VADIDVLITVGGADGTYQAALELRLTRKRLVPIGAFGGASSRLLAELLSSGTLRDVGAFEKLANPWRSNLASHVVSVVGADRPSKILLIHGHAKDRIELKKWLEDQKSRAQGRTIPSGGSRVWGRPTSIDPSTCCRPAATPRPGWAKRGMVRGAVCSELGP
jgi:hypothetical protein